VDAAFAGKHPCGLDQEVLGGAGESELALLRHSKAIEFNVRTLVFLTPGAAAIGVIEVARFIEKPLSTNQIAVESQGVGIKHSCIAAFGGKRGELGAGDEIGWQSADPNGIQTLKIPVGGGGFLEAAGLAKSPGQALKQERPQPGVCRVEKAAVSTDGTLIVLPLNLQGFGLGKRGRRRCRDGLRCRDTRQLIQQSARGIRLDALMRVEQKHAAARLFKSLPDGVRIVACVQSSRSGGQPRSFFPTAKFRIKVGADLGGDSFQAFARSLTADLPFLSQSPKRENA
jgi:hypothetical protein